jgi:hypothetical protein
MAAFQAVASGDWNVGATWGNAGDNTEGSGWPSTNDTAEIDSANKTGGQGAIDVALVADVTVVALKLYSNSSSHVVTISAASEYTITCTGSDFSGYCWLISAWTDFDGTINLKSTKSSGTVHHQTHSSGNWPTDKPHDVTLDGGMNLYSVSNLDISGTLTINSSNQYSTQHMSGGTSYSLTVAEDVSVTGTLTGNASAIELGSLTINSGGTYSATSGTTTITGENLDAGVGSGSGFAWDNLGTFTHNNGKVVIDTAGNNHTLVKETTFYDLEVNQTSSTYEAKFRPKTGTHSEILNNFTLTSGIYEMHVDGDTLDIYGLTTIEADGQFLKDAEHTGLVTHHGLVTNRGNYMLKDGVTVKMNGGIRQLGTFTTP